jgi:hypothetical protein
MPKGFLMEQISRPFQIALMVVALFAAVWLFALQGHSSSSSPSARTPTTPASTTTIYHGAAPGVSGLTKAIAKAHGAVATSQQNAQELEAKSAQASTAANPTASGTSSTAAPAAKAPAATVHVTVKRKGTAVLGAASGAPAGQRAVESDLAKGKVVVLLFWNPAAVEDQAVHQELARLRGNISIRYASPAQVTSYGTITRGVPVPGTPTLLIINKQGQTITLTGLQDSYSVEQAITEVRGA